MISFINSGEIDPRLITTLGCNVKDGDSPIGYFGTGLKYAIAVLLREGQSITIWSGETKLEFSLIREEMRGKAFKIVAMNGVKLGYTTEYGKNWSIENAFRELWCNAKDEGGECLQGTAAPAKGTTCIQVDGLPFNAAYENRWEFLLDPTRKPLFSIPELGEIYAGSSKQIFYRGVSASPAPGGQQTRYTYNITKKQKLTEDRTLASDWETWSCMVNLLSKSPSEEMLRDSLKDEQGGEKFFYFSYSEPAETFYKIASELYRTCRSDMNKHAKEKLIAKQGKPKQDWRKMTLTEDEQSQLNSALEFWGELNFSIADYPIWLVHKIPDGDSTRVLACAEDGQIWLTPECFASEELLRVALLEEYIHLRSGVMDETREMQNVLFSELYRVGGLVRGRG